MAMEISGGTQRLNTHTYDAQWGLLMQDVANTLQDQNLAAGGTWSRQYNAAPILLSGTHSHAGTDGDETSTITWTFPVKLVVVDMWRYLRTISTGGTLDLDVVVTDGTNDLAPSDDIDGDTVNVKLDWGIIDDAYATIDAAGTLKCVMTSTGTPTGGVSLLDVHFLCIPVR